MTYTVKKGDNLTRIAQNFSTTVDVLMKLNPFIKNKNNIQVGWVLTLPTTNKDEAIGKQLQKCLDDIENLDNFQTLVKMLG